MKLAFKAYKAYNDCKEELGEFADDYDELNVRLTAMQPILDGLANRLDDSLSLTLELAKSEQEKANKYTEELLAYTRRFKGHAPHFSEIATALAAKAVAQLPGPLQEVGNALLPVIKKHGVPEKAYAKFADKLHFLMSALSAAAATQLVKHVSMDRGASAPAAGSVEMTPNASADNKYDVVSTADVTTTVVGSSEATPILAAASVTTEAAEIKLKTILEENIAETDEPFRAILIGSRSIPYTLVFGLWIEGKPHLLTVTFFGLAPASMRIITAPSTDYILQLQKDSKRVKKELGVVRKECKATPGSVDKRKNHDVILWGLIPYLGIFCNMSAVYCNCMWTRLTMDGLVVNGNKYVVKMADKKILINDSIVFEPSNLPVDAAGMMFSCCCACPMMSEMCC